MKNFSIACIAAFVLKANGEEPQDNPTQINLDEVLEVGVVV